MGGWFQAGSISRGLHINRFRSPFDARSTGRIAEINKHTLAEGQASVSTMKSRGSISSYVSLFLNNGTAGRR